MNTNGGNDGKIIQLANETMRLARNTLIIHLRFMDTAISRLKCQPEDVDTFAVDGERIYYSPIYTLQLYRAGREQISHAYLHMVLHCVFRHFFFAGGIERELWDLACDMAVENIIHELDINELRTMSDDMQGYELQEMKKLEVKMTAERIYRYLKEHPISDRQLKKLSDLFKADDHSIWYIENDPDAGNDRENDGNDDPSDPSENGSNGKQKNDESGGGKRSAREKNELDEMWKNVSERMQTDLETFSKSRGEKAGDLMQNLRHVNREKYDYTAFLKKFAKPHEAMIINEDEFDQVFYSYGMQLFPDRRMPLIEPLEYKEVKRIRDFVIAIDTSGSVSGQLVQKFIQKTYNILKHTESFFSRVCLHIIQCDAEIQEDIKITTQEEFEHYIGHMQLKGFGGTDFRPVFERVDALIHAGEFSNLKGMIYFTDGYGTYPERKPAYETAFVFINEGPEVPPWAIRLVLEDEDLQEGTYEY